MSAADTWRYRVVPFLTLIDKKQMFTLVHERLDDTGAVVQDERQQMDTDVFKTLHDAVVEAARVTGL